MREDAIRRSTHLEVTVIPWCDGKARTHDLLSENRVREHIEMSKRPGNGGVELKTHLSEEISSAISSACGPMTIWA